MALEKAQLVNVSRQGTPQVEVQLNPTELTIRRGVHYADINIPGLQKPLLQFVRGEAETLDLTLLLDGTDDRRDLTSDLERIRAFVRIDSELHAPPVCELRWGGRTHFTGVMTVLSEKFVHFEGSGAVTRARLELTLRSFAPVALQLREINRQSPDRTKTRVVGAGDRLDLIAHDEYGDAALWPVIARHNDIARVRCLRVGTLLEIPPLET